MRRIPFASSRGILPLAAASLLWLSACGGDGSSPAAAGGGGTNNGTGGGTVSAQATFPTGLAVGSPADISSASSAQGLPPGGARVALDWSRAAWHALASGDGAELGRLAAVALPLGSARADTAMVPDLKISADRIEKVLSGDTSISLDQVLALEELFGGGGNANCYGPSLAYQSHEDALGGGPMSSGTLPGGDLGLWLEYENGTQPCVAAQLSRRVAGAKGQATQGLLLMAAMRLTVARSSVLSMPAAGSSTDIATDFATLLHTVPAFASINVYAASISLDGSGAVYTYRLAIGNGATDASARSGEIIMRHTPGSSASSYSGTMQVSGFWLTLDPAMGCIDATSGGLLQAARVSTLRYSRSGTTIAFASRSADYCGAPASTASADWGADVASFTTGGELDPTVKLSGAIRGSTKGWRGNFARFAGDFDRNTVAGNFLYAWQAGTGDGNSRALAVNADYNSATETRSLQGFFAFAGDIASTDGSLLGMICNWAGPGNQHAPQASFQSQTATLSASALGFVIPSGGSKITYAPTNSCSSTTTEYDANVDGSIASGEGAGTAAVLDAPTGSNTVQQEIEGRGFAKPSLF